MNGMNNIGKLYAIRFFHSLIPAYVIERLFWEQRGMTIELVVYTEIIYAVTIVLLELPTGVLADKWGRKYLLIADAFLGCCEFLILLFATKFWHFALVVFLAGVGRSASSGAENALLYDTLVQNGREREFEKVLGRMNAVDIASIMSAALLGSFLASRFGLELNYWISFASMLVTLGLAMTMAEPAAAAGPADEPIPVKTYVQASLRFFGKNPGVCLVVLSGMVTGAAISFIDEFWQTYLNRLDVPVVYFGLFSAAIFLLRLPGNMLAYALVHRFSPRTLLAGVTAALTAGFSFLSMDRGFAGVAAMCLICLVSGLIEPLAAGYLHHRIDSAMRATMDSFQSLGQNALLIVTGLGFGFYSSRFDIFGGFGFIAVMCGGFCAFFLIASRRALEKRRG